MHEDNLSEIKQNLLHAGNSKMSNVCITCYVEQKPHLNEIDSKNWDGPVVHSPDIKKSSRTHCDTLSPVFHILGTQ